MAISVTLAPPAASICCDASMRRRSTLWLTVSPVSARQMRWK
jgi:hypothetical protein